MGRLYRGSGRLYAGRLHREFGGPPPRQQGQLALHLMTVGRKNLIRDVMQRAYKNL
jgi:hypothetical protein